MRDPARLERLAQVHAAAFAPRTRGWSAQEIGDLAARGRLIASTDDAGFALFSIAGDEAELLTIAVAPNRAGAGLGGALLSLGLSAIAAEARAVFLEVAEDNAAARALYQRHGFAEVGRRPRYYAGGEIDALTMRLDLVALEM